jgi:hypothetical protein
MSGRDIFAGVVCQLAQTGAVGVDDVDLRVGAGVPLEPLQRDLAAAGGEREGRGDARELA